ncbi:N-acetyl-1-D-myo-inositol-2-amino-2-deoxy-alpha-D-glucopyranoside deacetylase [Tomitella fengzijianii]|uniref:N-acetyl-1-D-myo-inositol-2-amino-2-deoxy-alpha- D-glucopyranoside deacetylase n=1 Tax=Tomitella fengzijianii TaxID=2597660 RepID=UPI001E363A4E|nr:N-acetyl-1-D-myo-inositol-2-amino-2-deoxy-alpha-D-glucopyranoside deacetylase [Tomitella fengzijianii]
MTDGDIHAAGTGVHTGKRMLLVHAHPDDETITTGGTIARYLAEGVEVTVVTCTLGEQGEVIGDEWAQLVAEAADQLGGYRIVELSAALRALGCPGHRFLGGAGRWRDSGMAGTPAAEHPRAFVRGDGAEAMEQLAAVVAGLRPHVVITYGPDGGYGHPDHIRAHTVTMAAVERARARWDTPKVYWTVAEDEAVAAGLADLGPVPGAWAIPDAGELPAVPASTVTAEVDISAHLDAKRAALAAHATQVQVAEGGRAYALSNGIAQPVVAREFFVLARGGAGPAGPAGRETDLLAGLGAG